MQWYTHLASSLVEKFKNKLFWTSISWIQNAAAVHTILSRLVWRCHFQTKYDLRLGVLSSWNFWQWASWSVLVFMIFDIKIGMCLNPSGMPAKLKQVLPNSKILLFAFYRKKSHLFVFLNILLFFLIICALLSMLTFRSWFVE